MSNIKTKSDAIFKLENLKDIGKIDQKLKTVSSRIFRIELELSPYRYHTDKENANYRNKLSVLYDQLNILTAHRKQILNEYREKKRYNNATTILNNSFIIQKKTQQPIKLKKKKPFNPNLKKYFILEKNSHSPKFIYNKDVKLTLRNSNSNSNIIFLYMINGNYPASLFHKFIRLLDHRNISILVDNSIDKKVSKILNLIPSKINQINSILTNYPFPYLVTFTDNRKVRYIFDIKEEVLREILTDNK